MADRGSKSRIPIWVRVPVIVALVIVGTLMTSMLLGTADIGGGPGSGHGGGGDMTTTGHAGAEGGASGTGHGRRDDEATTDHAASVGGGSGQERGSNDHAEGNE